jgi:hypothetical protein
MAGAMPTAGCLAGAADRYSQGQRDTYDTGGQAGTVKPAH